MRKYEFVIADNEQTINEYAESEGLELNSVYYRIKKGLKWRYAIPEMELLIIIDRDSYQAQKVGRKKGSKITNKEEKK